MKLFLPFAATVALLFTSGTDALNVKIPGVNYTSRKGPPGGADSASCKTAAEVQNDMNAIKTVANKVRITSLSDCNQGELVLTAARVSGLQVHLSMRTSKDPNDFVAETEKLTQFINSGLFGDHVSAVSVGSSSISRGEVTVSTAINNMKDTRALIRRLGKMTLVTIDESIAIYEAHGLVSEVDFASVIYYAFWEKANIKDAVAVTLDNIRGIRSAATRMSKKVLIVETGWSSSGIHPNAADSSPENQAKFYAELYEAFTARDIEWSWFSAIDAGSSEREVDKHFGLFTEDTKLKSHIEALTITLKKPMIIRSVAYPEKLLSEFGQDVFMNEKMSNPFDLEQQIWYYDAELQHYISPTTRCLDAYQPFNMGDVHVFRCIPTELNQKWEYDNSTRLFRHLTHKIFCLNTDLAMGYALTMWPCDPENPKQQWTLLDPASA